MAKGSLLAGLASKKPGDQPQAEPTEQTGLIDTKPGDNRVQLTLRLDADDWKQAHNLAMDMRSKGDKTASVQTIIVNALDAYFKANGLPGTKTVPRERGGDRRKQ